MLVEPIVPRRVRKQRMWKTLRLVATAIYFAIVIAAVAVIIIKETAS